MMNSRKSPQLEELHAELLYLVTRYSCAPQGTVADAIAHQLQRILNHPLIDVFPQLRKQCAVSLSIWRQRAGFLPAFEPCQQAAVVH
jgi:hypothetical protein